MERGILKIAYLGLGHAFTVPLKGYTHYGTEHRKFYSVQLVTPPASICGPSDVFLGKSRKRARMAKKAALAKKPEKAIKVSTMMDTKNTLRSKINHDALDKLNEELGYAPAFEVCTKSNCRSHGDIQLTNEKNSRDDKFEHESNGYSEEGESQKMPR